ncbi:hypothetical protein GE21DRAFT_1049921 [Neurospora crassa]|nr:hypothetical protein GE21DRAFT_1049921 [Neurospora crassa]
MLGKEGKKAPSTLGPFSPPISIVLPQSRPPNGVRTRQSFTPNYRRASAHEHYQGRICLVHPSSSAPCRFLYVAYITAMYHLITTLRRCLLPVRTPHEPCRPCNGLAFLPRRFCDENIKPVGSSGPSVQFYCVPQHSQGYPVPRKGRRRHRPSITVPKHHIPMGPGAFGTSRTYTKYIIS